MNQSRKEYKADWYQKNKERLRRRESERYYADKSVRLAYKLKTFYGLSLVDYDTLVKKQNKKCAICARIPAVLCVDHCHDTGKVRGLLCHGCNLALGHFKNGELLSAAKSYLQGVN